MLDNQTKLSECDEYFHTTQICWDENRHGLRYQLRPALSVTKYPSAYKDNVSKIELIATCPTFDKKGEVRLALDDDDSFCVCKNSNVLKIRKYFDKLKKRIKNKKPLSVKVVN